MRNLLIVDRMMRKAIDVIFDTPGEIFQELKDTQFKFDRILKSSNPGARHPVFATWDLIGAGMSDRYIRKQIDSDPSEPLAKITNQEGDKAMIVLKLASEAGEPYVAKLCDTTVLGYAISKIKLHKQPKDIIKVAERAAEALVKHGFDHFLGTKRSDWVRKLYQQWERDNRIR